jgi:hypothetical protein
VKSLKDLHGRVEFYILGQKLEGNTLGGNWVSMKHNGLPKCLPLLRKLVDDNPNGAITLTAYVRILRLEPEYDVRTIIGEYTGTTCRDDWKDFGVYTSLSHSRLRTPDQTPIHASIKAGPNGPGSIFYSGVDAVVIKLRNQAEEFKGWCESVGLSILSDSLDNFLGESKIKEKDTLEKSKMNLAKLAFLSDKAGKTRIVFILN